MTGALRAIPAVAAAMSLAACAAAIPSSAAPTTRMTAIGPVFANAGGMTLYTYDDDVQGASECYGLCAIAWPPAQAAANAQPAGDFTVISRADGTKQWAYKGAPLYGYFRDAKPGDTVGDEDEAVWHVAKP
jgi:predicted lipoprotein with Yx(FWY)xxD motif